MDTELLKILQHSLGVDKYGQGKMYRNHYCAGGGDVKKCNTLVKFGYMHKFTPSEISGGDPIYTVTSLGKTVVMIESPSPPKITKSQKRYELYLRCESNETFGEWLKNSYWDDYRKRCGV